MSVNMTDILLAKPILPDGWLDCSVGEPHVVRENLIKVFDLSVYELPQVPHLYEYPEPMGYRPLVKLLEDKHHAPVIITNGAKQGLGACFFALKQMGKEDVLMRQPYWALIPPLAKMHGLDCVFDDASNFSGNVPAADSVLCLSPNNPDGWTISNDGMKAMAQTLHDEGIPFIHDAAYFTPCYIPDSTIFPVFGDAQIYSISKMLGLSGLRIGYVVCHSAEFYKWILHYMENMTVGVSTVSQVFLYDLMRRMNAYPTLTQQFEGQSFLDLQQSKKIVKQIDPQVLEVPTDIEQTPGMFLWAKVGPKADFNKSKVNVIAGDLFGAPGFVRMNLAFQQDQMQEIVNRLNSVLE